MKFLSLASGLLVTLFFSAQAATAQTTNSLSSAEIKGRELARQIRDAQPTENFTKTGVLQIRDSDGNETSIPVKCQVVASSNHWDTVYTAYPVSVTNHWSEFLQIRHAASAPNEYLCRLRTGDASAFKKSDAPITTPFAHSDFWQCDLGLEFFQWPEQKILPKATNLKRGRAYTLLESTNPHPTAGGYSRVVSWIDKETGGILEADAYDAQGRLLKVFEPKSFKKIHGQWQLQEMEIRNAQTDSRTRLEFDLDRN